MSVGLYVFLYVMSYFLSLWLVKNIIVIEVEVNKLHEGKILSRPSTSMTMSAVAQENKKNNERLSWAVPHSKINQTKNCPLLQYNRGPIMYQGGHMLQQENKGNNKRLNWAVLHSELNQKLKKCPPQNLHTVAVYVASRNFSKHHVDVNIAVIQHRCTDYYDMYVTQILSIQS